MALLASAAQADLTGVNQAGEDRWLRTSKTQGRETMRVMIRFSFPVEPGNAAIRTGKLEKVFTQLLDDLKPEAAYFHAVNGDRGGSLIVNMQESSQIADIAERLFFGINAKIELIPVMSAEDLQKGLSGVQDTIQRYG
jgi:hypothetical protein